MNMASFPARNTNMNGIQIVTKRKKKLLSYLSMKNLTLGDCISPVACESPYFLVKKIPYFWSNAKIKCQDLDSNISQLVRSHM